MPKFLPRFILFLLVCFLPAALAPAADEGDAASGEGVREQWGEFCLILNEPVVSRSVVDNGRKLAQEGWATPEELAEAAEEGAESPAEAASAASTPPSPADCGLELFTISGSPAPRLRWVDQNRLRIEFAPGSSPETEYRLVFKPGTTYLSGAPLATAAFSFRCKPVSLTAEWLEDHAGGVALLSAAGSDTLEAQQLAQKHEGLRVTFRRMLHVPLVGWICTSTVPGKLRVATLADGLGSRQEVFEALLRSQKPEEIRPDSPLPQCLLALPQEPLAAGVRYDIEVTAEPGSGFNSGICELPELPEALAATLERALVAEGEGTACGTLMNLRFSHPMAKEQLQAVWENLGVAVNGQPATRQEDGSFRAELAGKPVSLQLKGLAPCTPSARAWHENMEYHHAPAGCAQGLDIAVLGDAQPLELRLSLPAELKAPHGLALGKEFRTLSASISPASPALTGNGSNLIAWSGEHRLRLPLINVGSVKATAYRWDAASAARLLPLIQHGMRDDTVFCELFPRLAWMRRRAKEGLSTEGWLGEDARTEAGRALHLLQRERAKSDPLREKALAAATAYAPCALKLTPAPAANGLVSRGEAELDLDQLTGGKLRPGLYLISLSYEPTEAVQQALAAYGMNEAERNIACTVDYLVQVTDMSLRWGKNRLLVNSLATGQPLDGGSLSFYQFPAEAEKDAHEEQKLAAAAAEAVPAAKLPTRPVQQGEAQLPEEASDKLLLVQRGEDYALFSLWQERVRSGEGEESMRPAAELFCDRPLYRPGDVVHLRAVVRRPIRGGLALPRAQRASLTIHKPNGDVLERRSLALDAYGALAADFTLPQGEEDVAGTYLCKLQVEESGKPVSAEQPIACEVFRRDAFKATLRLELDPIAPRSYRASVQATDYNGTPVAGGKVSLKLHSTAPLLDAEGKSPEGLASDAGGYHREQELQLDGEGCASFCGQLAAFEQEGRLYASASVANDREEYVQVEAEPAALTPADFLIRMDGARRLRLMDARSGGGTKPLSRAQEVELRVIMNDDVRRELPSGISVDEEQERELACHRISVPANCAEGVALHPLLESLEWKRAGITLRFSGQDAEGRSIRHEQHIFNIGGHEETKLVAEGRNLRLETSTPFEQAGQVHAYISSQGKLRHELVAVEAGAQSVCVPLAEHEYGDIRLTLVSCEQDAWGTYTRWRESDGRCELPRPDKNLQLQLTLPEGAKPGERVTLCGRVTDAAGQPVKAAVTLFAVDAGMMSVAPYSLPELASNFYRGRAESFYLSSCGRVADPCRPMLLELPNVWSTSESEWEDSQGRARYRSVWPAALETGAFMRGVGALFRQDMSSVVRAAQPDFSWSDFFGFGEHAEMLYSPAAAPVIAKKAANDSADEEDHAEGSLRRGSSNTAEPRLRANFEPVALWLASVESAEDGTFTADCTLPDTLTTYDVYALALGAAGDSFGQGKGAFPVSQDVMLTPGIPFFMSSGDKLQLPLTLTNNTDQSGSWEVSLEGAGELPPQQVTLEARSTTTLYFDVQAGEEGTCTLRWTARSTSGSDAVQGSFPLRYPAPLLKEAHRLVLTEGAESVETAPLLAAEVGQSTRGELELQYSTSPLIHLAGSIDFLLDYPYGCTEQRSSALLPWLFYDKLAPFCPQMSMTPAEEARSTAERSIGQILARQQEDGGLSYWPAPKGERAPSSPWASTYAGLVLTIAQEQGYAVPADAMGKLREYIGRQKWPENAHLVQYAAARARGRNGDINRILVRALRKELEDNGSGLLRGTSNLEFIAELRSNPAGRHASLLNWLLSQGRDYRHRSSWSSGWALIALSEYLRLEKGSGKAGSLLVNGQVLEAQAAPGSLLCKAEDGKTLAELAPKVAGGSNSVYISLKAKAQPQQTEYPGVTEKGLQVTRLYEVKDADGTWRATTEFKVGDIVRVTLTCAKMADELEYFVLEDYLPACMEAINPNVPGQAAGLEDSGWGSWSVWFDRKEYLADRVRGFCTRWGGRDIVNMSYYARVKRAGECMAAPAEAQLMYEPQCYGLSENARVTSISAQVR